MKTLKSGILAVASVVFGIGMSAAWSARAAADTSKYRVFEIGKAALQAPGFENLLNQEAAQGYDFRTVTYYGNYAIFERR